MDLRELNQRPISNEEKYFAIQHSTNLCNSLESINGGSLYYISIFRRLGWDKEEGEEFSIRICVCGGT